jgi:hypothetical protein
VCVVLICDSRRRRLVTGVKYQPEKEAEKIFAFSSEGTERTDRNAPAPPAFIIIYYYCYSLLFGVSATFLVFCSFVCARLFRACLGKATLFSFTNLHKTHKRRPVLFVCTKTGLPSGEELMSKELPVRNDKHEIGFDVFQTCKNQANDQFAKTGSGQTSQT